MILRSPILLVALAPGLVHAAPVDFARDIQPIVSENCFQCHGFDPATRHGKRRVV